VGLADPRLSDLFGVKCQAGQSEHCGILAIASSASSWIEPRGRTYSVLSYKNSVNKKFVVEVVDPLGQITWLTPSQVGRYTFGPRAKAKIFASKAEAQAAIDHLPAAFHRYGFRFTIQIVK
jgi:hypothetical protein